MARGGVKVYIDVDASGAKRGTAQAEGYLRRLNTTGSRAMGGLGRAARGAAAYLGAGGLAFELKEVVEEAREANKVTAQTAARIKSTGGAARVSAKQVENLANSLSLKTATDDEAIQSSANLLLTFKKVRNEAGRGNDIFNQATETALDMSVAFGQDARSSVIQLGKALQDPAFGATALKRIGAIDTQGVEKIQKLAEQGTSRLKLQKILLAEIQSQAKGAASANVDPFDRLKLAVDQLEESVGKALLPTLITAAEGLTKFFNEMRKGEGTGGEVVDVLKTLGKIIKGVGTVVGGNIKLFAAFFGGLFVAKKILSTVAALRTLKATMMGMRAAGAASDMFGIGGARGRAAGGGARGRMGIGAGGLGVAAGLMGIQAYNAEHPVASSSLGAGIQGAAGQLAGFIRQQKTSAGAAATWAREMAKSGNASQEWADQVVASFYDVQKQTQRSERAWREFYSKSRVWSSKSVASSAGMARGIVANFGSMIGAVTTGLNILTGNVNKSLTEFGSKALKFGLKNPGKTLGGLGSAIRGGLAALASGGRIGGQGRHDTVPAMLAPGEAVLNRHQQGPVNAALGAVFGTNLDGLFSRIRTPHYLASGGYAGVSGDTDFVPQLGMALSRMAKSTGRSIYVSSGRRSLGEQAALYARYLAGGPLAAVPNPNAPHVRGIAADISPGRSVFGGIAKRFGLAFTVPSENWHVETKGGGLIPKLARLVMTGPPGALRNMGQGALDKTHKAGQGFLNRTLGFARGGRVGNWRKAFGATFDKNELTTLASYVGMKNPSLMAAIAMGESSGRPGAHGPPDGRGLWQIEWPIWRRSLGHLGNPYDPIANARMAKAIQQRQGLGAWVVYNRGMHRRFMGGHVLPGKLAILRGHGGGTSGGGGNLGKRFRRQFGANQSAMGMALGTPGYEDDLAALGAARSTVKKFRKKGYRKDTMAELNGLLAEMVVNQRAFLNVSNTEGATLQRAVGITASGWIGIQAGLSAQASPPAGMVARV